MSEPLEDRLAAAFRAADRLLRPGGEATDLLRQALAAIGQRTRELIRVAVVGRVSSGKSTLVNALIGEERVPTGSQELTYNVNRLVHGAQPGLTVHYKDRRHPPAQYSLADLASLTVRRERHAEQLQGIREIVVEITAPYLKHFELIDTPGLDSVFGQDSLNTLEFLRMVPGEVKSSTLEQAAQADALLLVVPIRGPSECDTGLLEDFLGAERADATPLNALGVLTKCEHRWEYGERHPLEIGRALAARTLREAPAMNRRLYDLTPVCSLVAQGAGSLDQETFEDLRKLAAVRPDRLGQGLVMASAFVAGLGDLPLDPPSRRRLWGRFGGYGLHAATSAIRDGLDTPAELKAQLLVDSGVEALRAKLIDHFGYRAALLKFDAALARIERMPHDLAAGLGIRERIALDQAIAVFTRLGLDEPGLAQLGVLRDLYLGRLNRIGQQTNEIRRILGEFGREPADRLGAGPGTPVAELRRLASERHARWAALVGAGALAGRDHVAARVVVRAYEYLLDELGDELNDEVGGQPGGDEVGGQLGEE